MSICKGCGVECIRSRCDACAKIRNEDNRAASLMARGGAPAKMTCGKCLRRGHRRTNCTWQPSLTAKGIQ